MSANNANFSFLQLISLFFTLSVSPRKGPVVQKGSQLTSLSYFRLKREHVYIISIARLFAIGLFVDILCQIKEFSR